MSVGYLLWLIGVAIAVIVGLSVFNIYETPVLMAAIKNLADGTTKALFLALALVTVSKFL